MDIFNIDKLDLFIIFFLPGFISGKVWSFIVPCDNKKAGDYLLDIVCYSCINFGATFWIIDIVNQLQDKKICLYIGYFLVLVTMPILWPIIIKTVLNVPFVKNYILIIIPTSWDYIFSKRESYFILVHLKDSSIIGGLYKGNSYTSSYPNKQDIYIEEVWNVDENGNFKSKVPNSKGAWIDKDCFEYIEFLSPYRENN
ncbi:DUF6338 family protein [Clostridium botulinum]|uniref:DUF6338 family protein n=1 Tax=Clostridium botulinum TaxID=1491 RepID=UPI00057E33B1|nr:DUF6338 family protein [Clostridium botulinum]MCD3202868.1 hypothetical protein [Clostridium botulinum C/D]MCD3230845.1 hypothetical protein [Clostridium botulinum C/D]MCD3253970.1 hypothetical protein [Clostridium botulinum C/D]MCD3279434.1 hypothetical protein [Clostridium botulinum C/D]MCD3281587.1 hypothetical protein [Clostridium botulinum C/D]